MKRALIHIFFPLMIGLLIYLIRGTENLHLGKIINIQLSGKNFSSANDFAYFIYFHLVDILWFYAMLKAVEILWSENKERLFWFIIVYISAIFFEISQITGLVGGTFDFWDLACYTVTFIGILLSKRFIHKFNSKYHEKV